ncbi:MAG: Heat shock protein GrpE [Olavius algarvensis Gamma 1 endosymbiont]|nr:MAG: Heat shock protein GrpE [Olavius algarvensis Gamma 1 endosymbiont]
MVVEREIEIPEQPGERAPDAAEVTEAVAATEGEKEVVAPAEAEAATADDAAVTDDADPAEHLTALLEDTRAKADEHWDQLLRVRAEMENLKRRQANELEKAHKFALDGFVRALLQVRDSLELGHTATLDQGTDIAKLREGTELTLKLLVDVMGKFGVEQIDPQGAPFDPEYHQAVTMQPTGDAAPNTVVTVIQKGYLLNGRLVRPAMVIVAAAPGAEQS